jgi:hypothetical protein
MLKAAEDGGPGNSSRFTADGVITDTECSTADHSHMRMGPTDAECGQTIQVDSIRSAK